MLEVCPEDVSAGQRLGFDRGTRTSAPGRVAMVVTEPWAASITTGPAEPVRPAPVRRHHLVSDFQAAASMIVSQPVLVAS